MTKEEAKLKEKEIKAFIKTLDNYSNEELVHFYKSAISKKLKVEKELFAPLLKEIERIRHKKGWITEIGNKGTSLEKTTEELKQTSKPKKSKKK